MWEDTVSLFPRTQFRPDKRISKVYADGVSMFVIDGKWIGEKFKLVSLKKDLKKEWARKQRQYDSKQEKLNHEFYGRNEDPHPECEYEDPCPECGTQLEAKWSGVKCPSCDYWFCY